LSKKTVKKIVFKLEIAKLLFEWMKTCSTMFEYCLNKVLVFKVLIFNAMLNIYCLKNQNLIDK